MRERLEQYQRSCITSALMAFLVGSCAAPDAGSSETTSTGSNLEMMWVTRDNEGGKTLRNVSLELNKNHAKTICIVLAGVDPDISGVKNKLSISNLEIEQMKFTGPREICDGYKVVAVGFGDLAHAFHPDFCVGQCGDRFVSGDDLWYKPGAISRGAVVRMFTDVTKLIDRREYLVTRMDHSCPLAVSGYNLFEQSGDAALSMCFIPAAASKKTQSILLSQCIVGAVDGHLFASSAPADVEIQQKIIGEPCRSSALRK